MPWGILNSARGLHPQDNTPQAQQARRIQGFADLDGIEFVTKVEMDKDQCAENPGNVALAKWRFLVRDSRRAGCFVEVWAITKVENFSIGS
jgi:hypothetical protein